MDTRRRKLPFWSTLKQSHILLCNNFPMLARVAWPWLLLFIIGCAAIHWLYFPQYKPDQSLITVTDIAIFNAPELLCIFSAVITAVSWHRLVLLSEVAPGPWNQKNIHQYVKYFLYAFVIWAIVWIPISAALYGAANFSNAFTAGIETSQVDGTTNVAETSADEILNSETLESAPDLGFVAYASIFLIVVVVILPISIILSYFPIRFSLALPASAIGKKDKLLFSSWQWTQSNFFRLFWGSLATAWPLISLGCVDILLGDFEDITRHYYVMNNVIINIATFISALIWVSFLSIAYKHLGQD